ncbi:hypothetical protein C9374_011822 [Naegleria lovaniensis]|uniref:Alcohol acetyltransferase n=1 Tax=Naegleria lovaniensis TaxID=51637 RepID=A0AA88GEI6_NAELO|nr:uncharacterized protein C9374_011822 [Naegleria lovaniensis]KAG2373733.1 hypothetical protein C9374_011822 [Naegleria lovaniensis]
MNSYWLIVSTCLLSTLGLALILYHYLKQHREHQKDAGAELADEELPVMFNSSLNSILENCENCKIVNTAPLTDMEHFFFQRFGSELFLGTHNLAVAGICNFSPSVVKDISVEKMIEICNKSVKILQYRHPMLTAVPVIKDDNKSLIQQEFAKLWKRKLEDETREDIVRRVWEDFFILLPNTLEFKFVENVPVNIKIDETCDVNLEKVTSDKELCQYRVKHELKHNFTYKNNSLHPLWTLSLTPSPFTKGKFILSLAFFHGIMDANAIKQVMTDFSVLMDYFLSEKKDPSAKKEIEKIEANIEAHQWLTPIPISPIEALLKNASLSQPSHSSTGAPADNPRLLTSVTNFFEFLKFLYTTASHNGLRPKVFFPVKKDFPEPCTCDILVRRLGSAETAVIEKMCHEKQITVTSFVHAVCTLAWTLCFGTVEEHSQDYSFTNSITVDLRPCLLPPLKIDSSSVTRNYASSVFGAISFALDKNKSQDSAVLEEIIWKISEDTKKALDRKYFYSTALYQFMGKVMSFIHSTFDMSRKPSHQMVFSNLGKLEPICGKNVTVELSVGGYSSCGSQCGVSNIFYTNSITHELEFAICYLNALSKEDVEKYMDKFIELFQLTCKEYEKKKNEASQTSQ